MMTIILAIAVLGTAAFFVIKGSASEKIKTQNLRSMKWSNLQLKSPKSRQT